MDILGHMLFLIQIIFLQSVSVNTKDDRNHSETIRFIRNLIGTVLTSRKNLDYIRDCTNYDECFIVFIQ